MTNDVHGSGTVIKRGTGTVQIDGDNVAAGLIDIENGLVLVGGKPDSMTTRSSAAATTLNGIYVDSWVQYSWLDATVKGQGAASESYDMDGFSASVEAGYRMPIYHGENGSVYLTPQGQVTLTGITADNHREANGTKVTSAGSDNVQTRLGMKISRDGVSDADKGTDKLFTVYAEANWLYNSELAGARLDGVTVRQAGSRNVGELKLGAEGQLNRNLNVWTNVAQQLGDKGYSDTAVTLGVKYRF